MRRNLKILNNLISSPDEEGNQRIIKKNIITTRNMEMDDVIGYEETFNNRGKILKNQCLLHLKDNNVIVVKHSFSEIERMKKAEKNKVGFKYGK